MTLRSKWNEFDKETRKYIKKRDKNECIICHDKGALQIMHVFVSRAKGGKGSKENGCLGCVKHHKIIDNPIGEEQNKESKKLLEYCKRYLIEKENIKYDEEFLNSLKFKKEENIQRVEINIQDLGNRIRCRNCIWLVKNKNNNSSINTYYCRIKRQIQAKNSEICSNFKNLQ